MAKKENIEKENIENENGTDMKDLQEQCGELECRLKQLEDELEEKKDSYLRLAAEFENYKKRTVKEKGEIYLDTAADTVKVLLPIIDNLERALASEGDYDSLKTGVQLVLNQTLEAFASIGVKEIEAVEKQFDPNLHNAVMHVEDESLPENVILEQFQKGYMMKDRVIRHSMVKVAN